MRIRLNTMVALVLMMLAAYWYVASTAVAAFAQEATTDLWVRQESSQDSYESVLGTPEYDGYGYGSDGGLVDGDYGQTSAFAPVLDTEYDAWARGSEVLARTGDDDLPLAALVMLVAGCLALGMCAVTPRRSWSGAQIIVLFVCVAALVLVPAFQWALAEEPAIETIPEVADLGEGITRAEVADAPDKGIDGSTCAESQDEMRMGQMRTGVLGRTAGVDGVDEADKAAGVEVAAASITDVDSASIPCYTVCLEPNGASGEEVLVDAKSTIVAPKSPFVYERHRFCGWTLDAEGKGERYGAGTDIPLSEDVVLYAQWEYVIPEGVEGLDFTSRRLVVGSDEQPPVGEVVSACDGVWLMRFGSAAEAAWAYVDLLPTCGFVAPDQVVQVAGAPSTVGSMGPEADLGVLGEDERAYGDVVALVDTGVTGYSANVVARTSVVGATFIDDNGHGTDMARLMVGMDPGVRIVSIKAADEWGEASAASVYAAIHKAIQMRAKVVNLSLCAPATEGNAAVEQAIRDAYDAGAIVVGAAGNEAHDAKWYVPAKLGTEAVIVGSCNPAGQRNASSNFGASVDLYVPSASTSGAAAKVSAWLWAHGSFGSELDALRSRAAHMALGFDLATSGEDDTLTTGDANRPDGDGPPMDDGITYDPPAPPVEGDGGFTVAAGASHLKIRGAWAGSKSLSEQRDYSNNGPLSGGTTGKTYLATSMTLNNVEGVDGNVWYEGWIQGDGATGAKSNGQACGNQSSYKALEDIRIWLTGTIAKCYRVDYSAVMSSGMEYDVANASGGTYPSYRSCTGSPFFGNTYAAPSEGEWTHIDNHAAFTKVLTDSKGVVRTSAIAANQKDGGNAGIRQIRTALEQRSYPNRVFARYQNADGSYTDYVLERDEMVAYKSLVYWWTYEQDEVYQGTTMDAYYGSYEAKDNFVSVPRRIYPVSLIVVDTDGNEVETGTEPLVSFEVSYDEGQSWSTCADALPDGLELRYGQTVRLRNLRCAAGTEIQEIRGATDSGAEGYVAFVDGEKVITIVTRSVSACTIRFDPNMEGATGQLENASVDQGSEYVLPSGGFAHELYDFVAWSTKPDGSGMWYSAGQTIPASMTANKTELTLYAQWNPKQLRVVVPAAIHYVAQSDGVVVGPDDGEASVRNVGELAITIAQTLTEVYDPYDVELGLSVDKSRLEPGEQAYLSNLRGHTSEGLATDTEVGCVHWTFRATGEE